MPGAGEAGAATARLAAVCAELLGSDLPPAVRDGVERVRRDLRRPLRLAVVGRVKSGKSTLVNALLGQRVARVDAAECTRAVTSFSYGHQEKVVVRTRDGRSWERAFDPDGFVPADLGAAPEEIDAVDVVLCNRALATTTVVDTPGLDSLTADAGRRTEELLGLDRASCLALQDADAVLFLVPQLTRADDLRLRTMAAALASTSGASGLSPATVVAVLSRADLVEDPSSVDAPDGAGHWPAARELADRYSEQLRGTVGDVVTVSGLLAETAEAALLTERRSDDLRRLAALGPDDRELLLLSADLFVATPVAGVGDTDRAALLDLLGLVGVRRCLRWIDDGCVGADALTKRLREVSGIERLHDVVRTTFEAQVDAIAAHRAMVSLESLSFAPGVPPAVRDVVEDAREEPALQRLRERDVLLRSTRGELRLPPALVDDLRALVTGGDARARLGLDPDHPAPDAARVALDAATRWLRLANDPRTDLPTRRAAETVRDSCTALWDELGGGP